uniref:WAP domain-containing protein n=1 Tax=Gouania willdenowi TaxID=441366 RepID=A0A8C5DEQ7_GOUWI
NRLHIYLFIFFIFHNSFIERIKNLQPRHLIQDNCEVVHQCSNDYDCPRQHKCCSYSCGRQCVQLHKGDFS